MTDSPALRIPLDPAEQPILDQLLVIRNRLALLKQDRSNFFKSNDVVQLYREVVAQVHALNEIRQNKHGEENRVDSVLDDCFQLISLSFMTVGKNSEAPAIYSVVSTIKRLLDHLKEAAFFSGKDLHAISNLLRKFRETLSRGSESYDPHLLKLLEARIQLCQHTLSELQAILSHLTPELSPVYEKLVSILRSLSACNVRSQYPKAEVEDLGNQLEDIRVKMHLAGVTGDDRSLSERYADMLLQTEAMASASAEKLVDDLLTRCLLWHQIVTERPGMIGESFKDTFDKLLAMRNKLESRSLLQAWSLRETDLYDFQRRLDRIDESRTPDGNFVDEKGNPADLQTQRTLLYLLRKSYALIYQLLTASEPVSEALLPIFNQLKTLKKCLVEVQKAGGVASPRELYPYSMKLNSIDSMRVDGKFMVGDEIPDGQAAVMQLMEECFDLTYQLRTQADEIDDSEGAKQTNETIQMQA